MKKTRLIILLTLFLTSLNMQVRLLAQTTTPVPVQVSQHVENIDGRYYILHVVERGQTLFSISRAYGVAIEQIRRTSDMASIQVGETLMIPTTRPVRAVATAPPPVVTVTPVETRVPIPVETETIAEATTEKYADAEYEKYGEKQEVDTTPRLFNNPPRTTLNVALMLPLFLGEVEQIRITPRTNRATIRPFSFVSFYQGAMLAAQQFYQEGIEINVHVFDVTEDTNSVVRLINGRRLHNMDIMIGPFFARSFAVASNFAKQQEIFIVNPMSTRSEILDDNPFVIKINTSEQNRLKALLNYAIQNSVGERIFVFSNDSIPNDKRLAKQTRTFFEDIEYRFDTVIFMDISKEGFAQVQRNMATGVGNSFISITNDDALVTAILTRTPRRDHVQNTLYSLRHSARFEVTDPFYLNNLQVHYIEQFFINHSDERVINFDRLFFETFQGLPDQLAYRGFDVMSFVLELLRKGNTNYGNYLETTLHKGFHNYIQLMRTKPSRGLENKQINILRVRDSVLQKANI